MPGDFLDMPLYLGLLPLLGTKSIICEVLCGCWLYPVRLFLVLWGDRSVNEAFSHDLNNMIANNIKILQLNYENPHIAIVKALQTFFHKKWHLDRAQFDKERIEKLLTDNKVDPEIINTLADILETCEMARFTNVQSSEQTQVSSLITETKDCIEKLDNY